MWTEQAGYAHRTCPAQYEAEPALNTGILLRGPGSWKGLSSLRCGWLGAGPTGCYLEGYTKQMGGFLSSLVVGCVCPASNSQGSAGRRPASGSQYKAKSGFPAPSPGVSVGPLWTSHPMASSLKAAKREDVCRAPPMGSDQAPADVPSHPLLPKGSDLCLDPDLPQRSQAIF